MVAKDRINISEPRVNRRKSCTAKILIMQHSERYEPPQNAMRRMKMLRRRLYVTLYTDMCHTPGYLKFVICLFFKKCVTFFPDTIYSSEKITFRYPGTFRLITGTHTSEITASYLILFGKHLETLILN